MDNKNNKNENDEVEPIKRPRGRPLNPEGRKSKTKEAQKKYQQEYYAKNKEKLIESIIKKVQCDVCGITLSKCNLRKHKAGKRCIQNYIDNLMKN